MKQVEVTILGQVYMLGCPPGGEALLATAVASVDREMSAIREAGKVKGRERMAVLAALNVAYQLAERAATPAGAALPTAAAPPAEPRADDVALVDALVNRIDNALGEDGQLL